MGGLSLFALTLSPLGLGKDIVSALFSGVLAAFGTGASALVNALLGFVSATSDPVFAGGWWSSAGEALFLKVSAVSASLLALAFMWSVLSAVLTGDRSLLARATLRLPLAVIQTALLVTVTAALVSATDEVSASIASGATSGLKSFVALEMAGAVAGSGIVGIACGGLVILAALGVWAELLCRSALIYLAVLIGPLVFAASVHPSLGGLRRRYVEGSLALICSKIVVALALATGSAMLSGLGASAGFSQEVGALMEALAVLLVACFAPFVLLRLFLGAETLLAAEGLARRPARAALSAAGMAPGVGGFSSMLRGLGGNGPSTGADGGGGAASAPPPGRPSGGGPPPSPPMPMPTRSAATVAPNRSSGPTSGARR